MSTRFTDEEVIKLIKSGRTEVFDFLFREYYAMLCQVVYRILPDHNYAEDIAQDVFLEIWKRRNTLRVKRSLKAYLRRMAVNKTLNFIRDRKLNLTDEKKEMVPDQKSISVSQKMEADELKLIVDKIVDSLPERCRIIFILNRFEEMSYKEIAIALNISVRTVENQISKALKILKTHLGPYL